MPEFTDLCTGIGHQLIDFPDLCLTIDNYFGIFAAFSLDYR